MPAGKHKSRSLRMVLKRTPSGNVKLHYLRKKPSKSKCASCGAALKGMPREIPSKVNKLSKSKRKPKRPYGGNLCSKCMRLKMVSKARIGA